MILIKAVKVKYKKKALVGEQFPFAANTMNEEFIVLFKRFDHLNGML